MDERLSVDFAMVSAVESVNDLQDQIWPLQPKKNAKPPFCFYEQITDDEEDALDGPTGMQHTGFRLHIVSGGLLSLSAQCAKILAAIRRMAGSSFQNEEDGSIFVEYVTAKQTSPDLYESDVGFYRRIYEVDFFYQTERSTE